MVQFGKLFQPLDDDIFIMDETFGSEPMRKRNDDSESSDDDDEVVGTFVPAADGQIISAPPQLSGDENRGMMQPLVPQESYFVEVQQQGEKLHAPLNTGGSLFQPHQPGNIAPNMPVQRSQDPQETISSGATSGQVGSFSAERALRQEEILRQVEEAKSPSNPLNSEAFASLNPYQQGDGSLFTSQAPSQAEPMLAGAAHGSMLNQFHAERMLLNQPPSLNQMPAMSHAGLLGQQNAAPWLQSNQQINFQRPQMTGIGAAQQQIGGLGFQGQLQSSFLPQQQQQQQQPSNMFQMEQQLRLQQQMMGLNSAPFQQDDQMQRLEGFHSGSLLGGDSSHLDLGVAQRQQSEVMGVLSDLEEDEDEDAKGTPKKQTRKRRAKAFPEKFMEALIGFDDEEVFAWLPDGKSFVVVDDEAFVQQILVKHFKAAKYSSFVRKLHRWGFVRLTSGSGSDCFHHPLFQKGRLDLAAQVKSAPRRVAKGKQTTQQKPAAASGVPSDVAGAAAPQAHPFAQPQDPTPQQELPGQTRNLASDDIGNILEPDPFPTNHNWGS